MMKSITSHLVIYLNCSLGKTFEENQEFREGCDLTTDCVISIRKNISRIRWDDEMGMAEVVEKKGGMWTTTGIVRGSKIYCSIEETM